MLFRWMRGVKAFTVHESPNPPAARDDRAEALLFVKDGFSFFAALLPPMWMIFNRLWLVLAGYLIVILGLTVAFGLAGIPDEFLGYASLALNLIIGFEADSLIRWTLDRKAWRQIGSVTGASDEDCERRFFESWLSSVPAVSTAHFTPPGTEGGLSTPTSSTTVPPVSGDVLPPKRTGWRNAMPWGRT